MDTFTSWRAGVSPDQMREIDRLAESEYGITAVQLMEVAGLAAARVARDLLDPPVGGRAVSVLAGPGNNGGDGLVAARRLAGWEAEVTVLTSYEAGEARGLSRGQIGSAAAAGVAIRPWAGDLGPAGDLIIDALLGFGAEGEPRGAVAEMIEAANEAPAPILALDIPSGLDASTGVPAATCVTADATVTLALPKAGLLAPDALRFVGRLFVADIAVPSTLMAAIGVDTNNLFTIDDIVELDNNERA